MFFLIDDLGWTDGHCFGSTLYETPNIDRLASQGMMFTDAYAAACLCSPTRASILTGKYPARLHITTALPGLLRPKPDQRFLSVPLPAGLPLEEVTIAEALKPAGYSSASVGKWHLGKEPFYPEKQGFDVSIGGTDSGMAPSFFYPGWKGKTRGVPIEGRDGEYLTDRLTDEALRFIESRKSQPFFLYLAHYAVHTPVEAKAELIQKYKRKVDPGHPQHNPVYAAMLEGVDESVGRVMKKLDDLGLAENTVIFFTSDNGGVKNVQTYTPDPLPPTSNVPLREGKATMYEGGLRVPLVVRWPGVVKPGSICHTPVISPDYYPTILEMAGVKPEATIDGVSLMPLLRGSGGLQRDAIYWHFPHYDFYPASVVRRGDYKLIKFLDDGRKELYDLSKDLSEKHDLARKMPKKTAELETLLNRWLKETGAAEMAPNPEYRKARE